MANQMKRKYTELDFEGKKKLIKCFESKKISKRDLAKLFNVSASTVCNVLKQREKIIQTCDQLENSQSVYRIKKPKHDQLDLYLFKWFQTKRKRNLIVSGQCLQHEAL